MNANIVKKDLDSMGDANLMKEFILEKNHSSVTLVTKDSIEQMD